MRIEWVKKVFSDGRHNAFTSLVFWGDHYYLTFRSGDSHGGVGHIVLLESSDLGTWCKSVPADTEFDDRDPKLLATPDRLLLYWVAMSPSHDEGECRTLVSSTEDGETWVEPQPAYLPGYSLWKPKAHAGVFYVAADFDDAPPQAPPEKHGRVDLLCSEDGLTWSCVSTITEGNVCTETSLVFLPDDSLLAIARRNAAPNYPGLALAQPPYEEWRQTDGTLMLMGPAAEFVHGTIVVSGRVRAEEVESSPDPDLGSVRTGLLTLDPEEMRLTWHANFPTQFGEDLSYPSIVPFGESGALISFYDGRTRQPPSDIFLASIEL